MKLISKYQPGGTLPQNNTYNSDEYEIDQSYIDDLRNAVNVARRNWNGSGFENWRYYNSAMPEGYNIDEAGIVYDSKGNAYVQDLFSNDKFLRAEGDSINITYNEGKPIEQNVLYYPVQMKLVKKPSAKLIDENKFFTKPPERRRAIIGTYRRQGNVVEKYFYNPKSKRWEYTTCSPSQYNKSLSNYRVDLTEEEYNEIIKRGLQEAKKYNKGFINNNMKYYQKPNAFLKFKLT